MLRWYWVDTIAAGGKPARTLTPFRAPTFLPFALIVGAWVGRRQHRQTTAAPLRSLTVTRED